MKFLMEHEMGFDANELGFPSIMGCHAVVYQTSAGLYGFHIAGGSGNDQWMENANVFCQFVNGHGGLAHPATRLYGASFVGNNARGYSLPAKQNWIGELTAIANALNYNGKISGYDLYKLLKDQSSSAYVEYRVNGSKCDLHVRKWGQHEGGARAPNPDPNGHKVKKKMSHSVPPTLQNLANVVQNVNRTGLQHVHKEKLRSG